MVTEVDPRTLNPAQRAQQRRDLRGQIGELEQADKAEIVFAETSPPKRTTAIYSMLDGERLDVTPKRAEELVGRTAPDGSYLFTAYPDQAPQYRRGQVRCFLHPESEYRASGVLEAAGIASFVCQSGNLASTYAMKEIARSKHKKQWQALESYLADQEKAEERQERRQQLEATLALARTATEAPAKREAKAKDAAS